MNENEINYTDDRIGEIQFISDFLPPPEQLAIKEETVKVTLALTKESVDFFKRIAKEQESHYQTMIRSLLEQYTERFDTRNKQLKTTKQMEQAGVLTNNDGKIVSRKTALKDSGSYPS